ncbi:MAG: Cell shape-determining protein MreC [Nitrospirae bacterium]|nr:Cell shape-determining protein MreC [Nitrospirota bacterium]
MFFFKKRPFIIVVCILLIFALLTYQSLKGESRFSNLAIYPLSLIMQSDSAVINGVKNILGIGNEDENRRLLNNARRLASEAGKYAEIESENSRLRALLNLKSERTDTVTAAEVFARDPTNWFQILWINKGLSDGISKDMAAVTYAGVVGRVHRVFGGKANIILLTDVNSAVSVRIQPSGIDGILEGRGVRNCFLKYVPQDAEIEIGQTVVTSGLDGIYPEGLLTGYITNITKKSGEFFWDVEVKPAQDLNAVEEVVILRR